MSQKVISDHLGFLMWKLAVGEQYLWLPRSFRQASTIIVLLSVSFRGFSGLDYVYFWDSWLAIGRIF